MSDKNTRGGMQLMFKTKDYNGAHVEVKSVEDNKFWLSSYVPVLRQIEYMQILYLEDKTENVTKDTTDMKFINSTYLSTLNHLRNEKRVLYGPLFYSWMESDSDFNANDPRSTFMSGYDPRCLENQVINERLNTHCWYACRVPVQCFLQALCEKFSTSIIWNDHTRNAECVCGTKIEDDDTSTTASTDVNVERLKQEHSNRILVYFTRPHIQVTCLTRDTSNKAVKKKRPTRCKYIEISGRARSQSIDEHSVANLMRCFALSVFLEIIDIGIHIHSEVIDRSLFHDNWNDNLLARVWQQNVILEDKDKLKREGIVMSRIFKIVYSNIVCVAIIKEEERNNTVSDFKTGRFGYLN